MNYISASATSCRGIMLSEEDGGGDSNDEPEELFKHLTITDLYRGRGSKKENLRAHRLDFVDNQDQPASKFGIIYRFEKPQVANHAYVFLFSGSECTKLFVTTC